MDISDEFWGFIISFGLGASIVVLKLIARFVVKL